MTQSIPMLTTFFIYISIMIGIGVYAYFSTDNFDDYILGGRKLGGFVTAMSAGASDMSGWLLMGLPGAIFAFGIKESWIALGLTIGAYLNWKFIAARLRVHTEINNALTLPDYFSHRFEDTSQVLRIISAVIILFFFAIYCASGIVASARLFESTFHLSYDSALYVGAFATVLYTFLGGFLAVSWTDTIQGTLMLFALIVTPIFLLLSIGSPIHAIELIHNHSPEKLSFLYQMTPLSIISLLGWGLGYLGQPHILARFMAAESKNTLKTARIISMTWMLLCLLGALTIGFLGIAYFQLNPQHLTVLNGNNERIVIEIAKLLFNPWVSGILLSAILAAVMSTLSCQLLVSSSAITEDIYKAFIRKNASQKELVIVGRLMVLAVAFSALFLAKNPNSEVLKLVSYAWSGFGAAFGPVILVSLFYSKMTRNSALVGMITGSLTVIIWKQYHWFQLYEIIPGFMCSILSIFITLIFDKPPSDSMVMTFNKAQKLLNE